MSPHRPAAPIGVERDCNMFEIKYLVWIWKRSFLGFWYKAPVVRIAHTDRTAARRLGRLFTFEDMMGVAPSSAE